MIKLDAGKEMDDPAPRWTVHKNLLANQTVTNSIIDLTMTKGVTHENEIEIDQAYDIHMLEATYTNSDIQTALETKLSKYTPLEKALRKNGHQVETSYMVLNTMIPFMHNEGPEAFLYHFFDKEFPITKEEIERFETKIWKITVNSLAEIARMYWKLLPPSPTYNLNDKSKHHPSKCKKTKG